MEQAHKRFSAEQVKLLLQRYGEGNMSRDVMQEILGIGKIRFFALGKKYRKSADTVSVEYERSTPRPLSGEVEQEIEGELKREKDLVEDERLPITNYNYSALRDRLRKKTIRISLLEIIEPVKRLEGYKVQHKHEVDDRAVVTIAIEALIQHDVPLFLTAPMSLQSMRLAPNFNVFEYSRTLHPTISRGRKIYRQGIFSLLGFGGLGKGDNQLS